MEEVAKLLDIIWRF